MSIPSSGLKVLVIDDSNTIRRSAEIFLKQGGYDVLLAERGVRFVESVRLVVDEVPSFSPALPRE